MALFDRILIAVDFSEFSKEGMRVGSELAQLLGSSITILHVCDTPKGTDPAIMTRQSRAIHTLLELQKEMAKLSREKLDEWVKAYHWGKSQVDIEVLAGAPYSVITDKAKERDIDLIIIGAKGRSGLRRMLIGSTTDRVVRRATCPVLSINLPES